MTLSEWVRAAVGAASQSDLAALRRQMEAEMATVTEAVARMRADVTEQKGVIASVVTLVNQAVAEMRANSGNAQAILDLAQELESNTADLAAAVAANPGGGAPAPVPEPVPSPAPSPGPPEA